MIRFIFDFGIGKTTSAVYHIMHNAYFSQKLLKVSVPKFISAPGIVLAVQKQYK